MEEGGAEVESSLRTMADRQRRPSDLGAFKEELNLAIFISLVLD